MIKDTRLALKKIVSVASNFEAHIDQLYTSEKINHSHLADRILKAINYFTDEIHNKVLIPIKTHSDDYKSKSKITKYRKLLHYLIDSLWLRINNLYNLEYLGAKLHVLTPKYIQDEKETKSNRVKGETYETTYKMFKAGQKVSGIAKIRNLTEGTIESHLSKLIKEKRISIFEIMTESRVKKIAESIGDHGDKNFTELKIQIPYDVTYGELRLVRSHIGLKD